MILFFTATKTLKNSYQDSKKEKLNVKIGEIFKNKD
jgi:hypothetical protein